LLRASIFDKNPCLFSCYVPIARFLSVEQCVYEYDLRKATSPILPQSTSKNLTPILQNQDEVNQIGLMMHTNNYSTPASSSSSSGGGSKGKRRKGGGGGKQKQQPSTPSLYIAAADDTGTVRFMSADDSGQSQILHHDPNGVAVVPTCVFRPKNSSNNNKGYLELASGGTDCKIHLWDLLKPRYDTTTCEEA
jgi:hypothetical protein